MSFDTSLVRLTSERLQILIEARPDSLTLTHFINAFRLLDSIRDLNAEFREVDELSKRPLHENPMTYENKDPRRSLNMSTGYLDEEKVAENQAIEQAGFKLVMLEAEHKKMYEELQFAAATLVLESEAATLINGILEPAADYLVRVKNRKVLTQFRSEDLKLIYDRIYSAGYRRSGG